MIGRLAMAAAAGVLAMGSAMADMAAASPANVHARYIAATDLSAQTRPRVRRARTRIEVRPLRGPLRRDCTAVFQERWIPQWGGRVLYAGQDCYWTRAPL